jgi:ubiquinone/menaquinone biosynthesis C-methylase UbiE
MKMGALEKGFINSPAHGRRVAEHAVRRLGQVPIEAGLKYLDVGCGNGLATIHVADTLRLRAVGVDVDSAQIALARHAAGGRPDVSFMTASATELPFDTGHFDIVFTNKALHHVAGWEQAIEEIKRVTAPGGHVVFADLNVPVALAPLLRRTLGHRAGIFTRHDLDLGFSVLDHLQRNAHWLHYEAVFRKPL